MTLAAFPKEQMSTVINLLTPVFRQWKNKNAWIGLRLTEYYVHIRNGNQYAGISFSKFINLDAEIIPNFLSDR